MAAGGQDDGEGAPRGVYVRLYASLILGFLFNPVLLALMLAQGAGAIVASLRLLRAGERPVRVVPVGLPFPPGQPWRVARGGVTRATSHSWGLPSQRYAYDFVAPEQTGGLRLSDHPAFGRAILAAAAGRVVAARDGRRDFPRCGTGWIDWRSTDPRGNHVLVRHDDGVHALYAHLRRGSVAVVPGQRVAAGEPVGRCGNSGHSTEPHLHFHLQDGPNWLVAAGLPPGFRDACAIEPAAPPPSPFPAADQVVVAGRPCAPVPDTLPAPAGRGRDLAGSMLGLAILLAGAVALASLLVRLVAAP